MEDKKLNKHSLEIPLYLNQKIVFDLLASINDGFTQVTKLKTAYTSEGSIGGTIEADLGNKNIFTLLGVKLKGKTDVEHNRGNNKEQEQEKIHTPSSLFNNLKSIFSFLSHTLAIFPNTLNFPSTISLLFPLKK